LKVFNGLTRREVLKAGVGVGLGLLLPLPVFAYADGDLTTERCLSLHNLHTGEVLKEIPYRTPQGYQKDALDALNYLLRDYRTGELKEIDPQLFDLLYGVQNRLGTCAEFQVISGYRSPRTNELLRRRSRGVAKHSLHMLGKAIDIRLPGCDLSRLRAAAVAVKGGGVGYYPKSNFVHVDTGRVRYW